MYFSWPKMLVFLSLVFFIAKNTHGQTSISGIINDYTKVTAVGCNYVDVSLSSSFASGDKVLIIQMQGATTDVTNTALFGDITAIGDAGNYEINEILNIATNRINLKFTMTKSYSPTLGSVQLVRIPQYVDVDIIGTLTAKDWDGITGGVLIFQASGIITLNANIDVSSKGFRGGIVSTSNTSYGCTNTTSAFTSSNNYYYAQPSPQAGQKGEGISISPTSSNAGKGKQANGGGGGNGHNSGGAGGGNYGTGGRGGDKASRSAPLGCSGGCGSSTFPNGYGIEGLGLSTYYSSNKIFLGGGGGGGHENDNRSFDAGDGGGIIIILGNVINNSGGHSILSKGDDVLYDLSDAGDGNSGGSGGGVVLLSINTVNNPIIINVSGGHGGDNNGGGYACRYFGPGGGGGGGMIGLNTVQPTITSVVAGGTSGFSYSHNSTYGAANGGNGDIITNYSISQSNVIFTLPCIPLPVNLVGFSGLEKNRNVVLTWSTTSETNNDYFILEKSTDGIHYQYLATIDGHGNSATGNNYSFKDISPSEGLNYYNLKQYDYNGTEHFLGTIKLRLTGTGEIIEKIYPNPFTNELIVETALLTEVDFKTVKIINLLGAEIAIPSVQSEANMLKLDLGALSKGVYFIQVTTEAGSEVRKIVKE